MINKKQILLALSLLLLAGLTQAKQALNDPTRPPAYAKTQAKQKVIRHLKLSAIRISESERLAVINGKRLTKGQSIGGYKVKKIAVGYVILINAKGSLRLNLISSRIIRKKR